MTLVFITAFLLKLVLQNLCYPEPGARAGTQKRSQEPEPELVAGTGAGQDWTGSTTLINSLLASYFQAKIIILDTQFSWAALEKKGEGVRPLPQLRVS